MMLIYTEIIISIEFNQFHLAKELKFTIFKSPKFTGCSQTFTAHCHRKKCFIFYLCNYSRQFQKHCNTTDLNVLSECNCVSGCDFWSQIKYILVPPKKKELQKTSYLQHSSENTELSSAVTFASVLTLFSKTKWFIYFYLSLQLDNIVLVCFMFNSRLFFSCTLVFWENCWE